jgi:hypothetical protein
MMVKTGILNDAFSSWVYILVESNGKNRIGPNTGILGSTPTPSMDMSAFILCLCYPRIPTYCLQDSDFRINFEWKRHKKPNP